MVAPVEARPLRAGMQPFARTVLAALDDVGVCWCLVRGTAGGDIDVLVAAGDLDRAVTALRAQGLVRLPAYGRGTHLFFLGLDEATGTPVELDLVTELAFGPRFQVRTGAAEACLARRRRVDGVWILAPEDEFWELLLHCVLDRGAFAESHTRRLAWLAGAASLDSPMVSAMPRGVRFATLLEQARAGQWRSLAAARGAILRARRRQAPAAVAAAGARTVVLRLAERTLLAWRRRGPAVALLGPDGSGKSTLAVAIEATSYLPVRRVYMGLWPSTDRPRAPARTTVLLASRPFVVWWRYLRALGHRARGRLVVFDRYVYDALLPPRGSLARLMRPYLWLLSRSCPAPGLVVVLDVPGEVMYTRSGEADPARLEADRQEYRRHANRIPHAVWIDSNRPREAVLADVMRLVWRQYRERVGR